MGLASITKVSSARDAKGKLILTHEVLCSHIENEGTMSGMMTLNEEKIMLCKNDQKFLPHFAKHLTYLKNKFGVTFDNQRTIDLFCAYIFNSRHFVMAGEFNPDECVKLTREEYSHVLNTFNFPSLEIPCI